MPGRIKHAAKIDLAADGSTVLTDNELRVISIRTGIPDSLLRTFLDGKLRPGETHLTAIKKCVNGPVPHYFDRHDGSLAYDAGTPPSGCPVRKKVEYLRPGDAVSLFDESTGKHVWLVVEDEPKMSPQLSHWTFTAGGCPVRSQPNGLVVCLPATEEQES